MTDSTEKPDTATTTTTPTANGLEAPPAQPAVESAPADHPAVGANAADTSPSPDASTLGVSATDPRHKNYRPQSFEDCRRDMAGVFDDAAQRRDAWRRWNRTYHREILRYCRFVIPEGARVLDVGCGTGELLAALKPSVGVGVDISGQMIEKAREKFPHLQFVHEAAETFASADGEPFDYIVLSDVLQYAYDILAIFKNVRRLCHHRTRIVMHFHSKLWQPALGLAERLGLKYRQPTLNWVTREDVGNLLRFANLEAVRVEPRILLPIGVPGLAGLSNRFLAKLPVIRHLCLTNWIVARPADMPLEAEKTTVSVVVACRNEEGNIPALVARTPKMGAHTELIFVEGNSKDDTVGAIEREIKAHPELDIKLYRQDGKGKGDAVRKGFAHATGDVLMILDADMTVPPEDLPQFFDALVAGHGEFINGSRLVYPMEGEAMRFLNLLGNKFFATAFSYLLGQRIKDTLCGTKVMLRADYERLARGRAFFGEFDPFGDYDLIFGAAKMFLKIVDVPIRYRNRTYGTTNINRFRDGVLLLRMCGVAFRKLKLS